MALLIALAWLLPCAVTAAHAAPLAQATPAEQAAEATLPLDETEPAAAPIAAPPAATSAPATAPTTARLLPTATPMRAVEPAEPFDWTAALLDVAWKLGVVVLLAYGALALLRRSSLAPMLGQQRGQLQVLESVSLGANRGVALLRVGERRVLVGVTPTQITSLAQWDQEATGPSAASAGSGVPAGTFGEALNEAQHAANEPALAAPQSTTPTRSPR